MMFQAMTSAFLASLLVGTVSAADVVNNNAITDLIGKGAPTNKAASPTVGQAASPTNGYTTFDPNAAAPILSPGQGQPASVSYGNSAAKPWHGPQAVQTSSPEDPMAALLGGTGGPAPRPAPPSGKSGGSNSQPVVPANPMATLLSGITSTMGSQGGKFQGGGGIDSQHLMKHGQINSQLLTVASKEVVSGLIEAFMHKYALAPQEKQCLEDNIGQLTGDLMGTVGDIITAIRAMVSGGGKLTGDSQGPLVNAGLDAAMKITGLVTSASQLAKGCVHGDALKMLKDTAHHMIDGKYLRHRFLVNGVDIARDLADCVISFEHHNFHKFGADIGDTLRKILLSDANSATHLPEGVPEKDIIQQTFDGLVGGFFMPGTSVRITDTAHKDVDISIDLHECMVDNEAFYKEIFLALWQLVAGLSANGLGGIGAMFNQNSKQGQPKWAGELMIAMMQFPSALQKCGISANAQGMFMEAIKTLQDVQVHFTFPQDAIQADEATKKMAKAVKAWTNWNFKEFGFELGKLFRELVMIAFPQKYSVDASGRLQRMSAEELPRSFSSPLVIISGASIFSFVALAVVRTRRALPQELRDHSVPMTDVEDGDDLEFVE